MVVGRRSQNDAGKGADLLEKLRNLVLWRDPVTTRQAVTVISIGLIFSLLLPPYILFRIAGLAIGIQIFIIQYLFFRFPRLKKRYDRVEPFLKQLKNDEEFEKEKKQLKKELKRNAPVRSQSMLTNSNTLSSNNSSTNLSQSSSSLNQDVPDSPAPTSPVPTTFNELFQLPISEVPVSAWQSGRRCTLVNKEKVFAAGFRAGKLYLTNNYMCFEKSKTVSSKNLVIPLETVKSVTKARLYHWIPGGGKTLEVKIKGSRKVFVFVFPIQMFGPLVSRDEAYQSILQIGIANDYAWAKNNQQS